jgi:hypothetical protein
MKLDTADEFLGHVLDATASMRKREDQLGQTAREFHTRVAECVEVGGGISEYLL